MNGTHGTASLVVRSENDEATAARKIVEHSKNDGMFNAPKGLEESLEVVTTLDEQKEAIVEGILTE
jgi:hypothetical protein